MKNKLKKIYFILSPIIFFIGLVTYFIFGLIPITCNIQSNIECFNNLPNFVRGFYYNLIFEDYHRNLYDDIAEIIFSLGLTVICLLASIVPHEPPLVVSVNVTVDAELAAAV